MLSSFFSKQINTTTQLTKLLSIVPIDVSRRWSSIRAKEIDLSKEPYDEEEEEEKEQENEQDDYFDQESDEPDELSSKGKLITRDPRIKKRKYKYGPKPLPVAKTLSSTEWLRRQKADPVVRQAQAEGLRSRSALKLKQLDWKHRIFKVGNRVVDLGAAPGGWSQIAAARVRGRRIDLNTVLRDPFNKRLGEEDDQDAYESYEPPVIIASTSQPKKSSPSATNQTTDNHPQPTTNIPDTPSLDELGAGTNFNVADLSETMKESSHSHPKLQRTLSPTLHRRGIVVAVDLVDLKPIPGVTALKGDFSDPQTQKMIHSILQFQEVDVVLSDMAPNFSGIGSIDHIRSIALAEEALAFAENSLRIGGKLVVKLFQGGTEREFLKSVQKRFLSVKLAKPKASRSTSAEFYVVAAGFVPPFLSELEASSPTELARRQRSILDANSSLQRRRSETGIEGQETYSDEQLSTDLTTLIKEGEKELADPSATRASSYPLPVEPEFTTKTVGGGSRRRRRRGPRKGEGEWTDA